jgi:hypothetical protein
METTQHQVGDVWKNGNKWLTKMPGGIIANKTKKRAQLFADSLKPGWKLFKESSVSKL